MKKVAYLVGILVLAASAAAFAQGPFADVPTDHWAYDAVNDLQMKGIVIGYPDGTFGGKRAMTRYEFAMAISRLVQMIPENVADRIEALEGRVAKVEGKEPGAPPGPGPTPIPTAQVTKEDLAKIQKLVDEFRDELASLGVDVDALRKDVAALNERVAAIEEKMAKIKVSFDGQFAAIMPRNRSEDAVAIDLDNRYLASGPGKTDLLDNVTFIREGDLTLDLKPNATTTITATLAAGNYLPYLQYVDAYADGVRPTSKSSSPSDSDVVYPYWLGLNTMLGPVKVDVGRIPIQWTQYTLKKVDVDELLVNNITDSGDYPIDGGKICMNLGKVGVEAFAAKNNSNTYVAGLVSAPGGSTFHDATGCQMGGLEGVEQSAGARVTVPLVTSGKLGLSYIEGGATVADANYDKAKLMGADLNLNLGKVAFVAEYAQTDTSGRGATPDVDDDNRAMDGKVGFNVGSLGVDAGYRRIERNFAAPGAWGKIGRWANPSNIKGPYIGLKYDFSSAFSIAASGELYKAIDTIIGAVNEGDKLDRAKVDLRYAFTPKTSFGAGYEWVRLKPDAGGDKDTDKYITLDLTHKINPDTMVKVGYQIVDYKPGVLESWGDTEFKGDVGYVQVGVKF